MLRLIWSHPEFPTKEDIRDELRRSELTLRIRSMSFVISKEWNRES